MFMLRLFCGLQWQDIKGKGSVAGGQEAVQPWSTGVSPSVPLRSVFSPLQAHKPLRFFVFFKQMNGFIQKDFVSVQSSLPSFQSPGDDWFLESFGNKIDGRS